MQQIFEILQGKISGHGRDDERDEHRQPQRRGKRPHNDCTQQAVDEFTQRKAERQHRRKAQGKIRPQVSQTADSQRQAERRQAGQHGSQTSRACQQRIREHERAGILLSAGPSRSKQDKAVQAEERGDERQARDALCRCAPDQAQQTDRESKQAHQDGAAAWRRLPGAFSALRAARKLPAGQLQLSGESQHERSAEPERDGRPDVQSPALRERRERKCVLQHGRMPAERDRQQAGQPRDKAIDQCFPNLQTKNLL